MFRIDRSSNRITRLKEVKFTDLGFRERTHLQEWLANQPNALGEDFLIIQKEFAGWDETRERLDLLALDKEGGLVIVENKLDDSGRDVVWQSLKYASYCSSLSKSEIVSIFQDYLNRDTPGQNAQQSICDFLGQAEFSEISLNAGNNQRLIMVAAHFRREVTSTVLWLLNHDVAIQCFKATPFQDGDDLFLNLEQIIPLPEAAELMVGVAKKEKEEKIVERRQIRSHRLRLKFWQLALDALERAGISLFANVSPGKDHWLSTGSGLSGVHYRMIFAQNQARVEFCFDHSQQDKNKEMFDALFAKQEQLEKRFGAKFGWRRMDENRASLIVLVQEFDGYNRESWPEMNAWLVDHVRRLENTFDPEIAILRQIIRG